MDNVDAVFGQHIGSIMNKDIPSGKVIIVPGCCMASYDRFSIKVNGHGCHGSTPEKGIDPVNIASHIVIALQEIIAPGCCMASYDRFSIKVNGHGCHGSTPEKGIDPVNIASHIVIALQEIIAREVSAVKPAVITIGMIHGGVAYNAIPSIVEIEGTIRALEEPVRQHLAKRIKEISEQTAKTFGGAAEVEIDWGAPPVTNDNEMVELATNAAKEVVGETNVVTEIPAPNMGGEDFAYYLQKAPGAFFFLSSSNPEKHTDIPHHNPHFNVDEDVLYKGSAMFVKIVEDYLK